MPQAKRHSKQCELCRKPFGSGKRHEVYSGKGITSVPTTTRKKKRIWYHYRPILNIQSLTVCGECKSNLHNWKHKKLDKEIIIHNHVFKLGGWYGICFNPAEKRSKKGSQRWSRYYGGSFKAKQKWMAAHEKAQHNSIAEMVKEKERLEFEKLLQEEAKEIARPLMMWIEV